MKTLCAPVLPDFVSFKYCCWIIIISGLNSCGQGNDNADIVHNKIVEVQKLINPDGKIIEDRFITPENFERIQISKDSFANYLRTLPLKPDNSKVLFYNGKEKTNENVYDAVVDLKIGNKDLHQCADAVIRLRAEYLYKMGMYNSIHFNFTNGFRADYSEWVKGRRITVNGNQVYWKQKTNPSNTYNDFWNYMEIIFTYAGTLSLEKELIPTNVEDLNIGDVFIKGGSPGHAVIVVDMAINKETNKKVFLLAQSYMPAQEIQILKNPDNESLSPWYSENFGSLLVTPEWTFKRGELKRFN